jgi:hypothetical protein
VERVYVPEAGFDRVLKRHPKGVVLSEAELRALLEKASARPAPVEAGPPPPAGVTLERLRITGEVVGEVAQLEATARASLLGPGVARLTLPLAGIGLRWVRVEGEADPAAVIRTRAGAQVLLRRPKGAQGPVSRVVRWGFAARVQAGDEKGSGRLTLKVPASASGGLELVVPGDVEAQAARVGDAVLWSEPGSGATTVRSAFGGAGSGELAVAWRPRRAQATASDYTVAEARSAFVVRRGVVTLEAAVRLEVYRAARESFRLRLPEGFVVRALRSSEGELAYRQRGDEVSVRLDAPRRGVLGLLVVAERATDGQRGEGASASSLKLRALELLDVARTAGVLGVASGPDARVSFAAVSGLERADLPALGEARRALRTLEGAQLLRVYRRGTAGGALTLQATPIEPVVDLAVKAALQVQEREVRALALYRYEVEAGAVYAVRAALPAGYAFETLTVRDGAGRSLAHQFKELRGASGGTTLAVELEKGLRQGEALLVSVQATRAVPAGLAGRKLAVPRFGGSPASRVSGHVGFAADEAFRLDGEAEGALVAIPAEELPRQGVDVPGLVLGYRIEGPDYAGHVVVARRETQVSARVLAKHRVHERVIDSEAWLELEVLGAPIESLEVLLPEGAGRLARLTSSTPGVVLSDDRELLGGTADGQERWKLSFERPRSGRVTVKASWETKLSAAAGGGESEALAEASLPRISVGSAFRERGVVAVYSSDATELVATPAGLRPIEVTEVPSALQARSGARPLYAYTHVGSEWSLGLTVQRPGAGAVLTAVAEQLAVRTSVGPDGVVRHTATWRIKNLSNQFFGVRLDPAGSEQAATLWSVVVDGVGVKPAEEGGLKLIPIPTAGKGPDQGTVVQATYSRPGPAWGVLGEADLIAPELVCEGEPVPVLKTRWEVALPDDYRVLEVSGNVASLGGAAGAPRPLLLSLGEGALRSGSAGPLGLLALLGLCALACGASARLRRGALVGYVGGLDAASALAGGLRAMIFTKAFALALGLLLGVLLVVGTCLGLAASRGLEEASVMAPRAAPAFEDRWAEGGGGGDAGGDFAPSTSEALDEDGIGEYEETIGIGGDDAAPDLSAAAGGERRNLAPVGKADALADKTVRKAKRPRRAPQRAGGLMPPGEPTPEPSPPTDRDLHRTPTVPGDAPGQSGPAPDPAGRFDDARSRLRAKELVEQKREDAPEKPIIILEEEVAVTEDIPLGTDLSNLSSKKLSSEDLKGLASQAELSKRISDLSTFGQKGLRSLVLQLPQVGREVAFDRPGGDARVQLDLVREEALVSSAGLLALVAFAGLLLLPRLRLLSAAGVVAAGLAALTAAAHLSEAPLLTPLLNAAVLGLLVGAPVVGLAALGRAWEGAPLDRLARSVRAVRGRRAG